MRYVVIGLGALVGANLRYVIGSWAVTRWGSAFPYGTFIINISGAFAIGLVLAFLTKRVELSPLVQLCVVTGFLGGYTTFSTYTWEALQLAQTGSFLRFGAYFLGSNALGLLGVWVGSTAASFIASALS